MVASGTGEPNLGGAWRGVCASIREGAGDAGELGKPSKVTG